MRRTALLQCLWLLAACSPGAAPQADRNLYAGAGRDRLCVDGDRLGFITYGNGDANCSASGHFDKGDAIWTLAPRGDADCRIRLSVNGDRISIGPGHPSCAYYCGPGATFDGKSFRRVAGSPRQATDLAGDPLC